jgi:hypothetical protein
MTATIIRELDGFEGQAVLVQKGERFYVVSSLPLAFDTGLPETLVFPADESGEVTSWGEVAGGRLVSREDAIKELGGLDED